MALRTNLARVVRYAHLLAWSSKPILSISANGGEAVSEYLDLPQRDPLLRLQLALALCRAGKWAESFKGLITVYLSAIFLCALVTHLTGFHTTYTFLSFTY